VGDGREFGVLVMCHVFGGSSEGEVGAEDPGGKKEGFAGPVAFSEEVELIESLVDSRTVGVDFIGTFGGLEEIHFFGVFSDFAIGESVHPSARVLPFTCGK